MQKEKPCVHVTSAVNFKQKAVDSWAFYGPVCQLGFEDFQNKVLWKISGPKRQKVTERSRKLHNDELHDLYSLRNIIKSGDSSVGIATRLRAGRSGF
jgi:hypothetical protein